MRYFVRLDTGREAVVDITVESATGAKGAEPSIAETVEIVRAMEKAFPLGGFCPVSLTSRREEGV